MKKLLFIFVALAMVASVHAKEPQAKTYPMLESEIANMGPGCRVKVLAPRETRFKSNYIGHDADGVVNPSWTQGGAGFILKDPPYLKDYWSFGFICYSRDSEIAQSRTLEWDSTKNSWMIRPEKRDILPDVFPEYRLTIYQIKAVNASGWAMTTDDTAVDPEKAERRLQYCIYYRDRAICGTSDMGNVETIQRHPIADRTPYVLKILQSIEFLEDEPPEPKEAIRK